MERPQYKNYEHRKRGLFPKDWISDQRAYIDQLEAENKELAEALKAISKVTEDAELPLLKAVHQISFKTLKAVK